MEEMDDGLLIYSNNANCVADSFIFDGLWEFSKKGVGGSILGEGNNGCHSPFPDQDRSYSLNTLLDSARCSYNAQPNSDVLPFSTVEDAEIGLEWLYTLEESSSASGSDGAGDSGESQKKQSHHQSKHVSDTKPWPFASSLCSVIPCRARSKRSRLQLHPSKPRLSTTQETSSTVTQTSEAQSVEEEEEMKAKKVKRKGGKGRERSNSGQARRCTHCQTQKTPQWRQGPLGPKSLCNACGVRFKTGRLYPEYRPAKSPSFVSYMHSNSHKRVLEMRTIGTGMHTLPASAPPVQILNHHSYNFL